MSSYNYLNDINNPDDLKKIQPSELPILAKELRHFLLNSVSKSSGHLASGLGVIELTIALHYIFNTPKDSITFDVGHQAYPHKILTGRKELLHTIRQLNGLHPFPWPNESPYDTFAVGHSSTSISIALGHKIAKPENHSVAVIGDGALTAGLAYEALNHTGDLNTPIMIILNDNNMSISENVGGFQKKLNKLLKSEIYQKIKNNHDKFVKSIPALNELKEKTKQELKSKLSLGSFFEDMGLQYTGPIDGHDIQALINTINNVKHTTKPQIIHIKTIKGKGYNPAENNPINYHGVPKFNPKDKLPINKKIIYSNIASNWLCEKAITDNKIIAITPAMREGSDLMLFEKKFPTQYFDVGIAEQHAVTLAASLASKGLKPILFIYSTFLQRAYDQLIHDVCLQNLPVIFAIDRAGIVGEDGATHQGQYDLAYLRILPNITIMIPSSPIEFKSMLEIAYKKNILAAIRYPKEECNHNMSNIQAIPIEIGKANTIHQGTKKIVILGFGTLFKSIQTWSIEQDITLIDMRFLKPLDEKCLISIIGKYNKIITIEEGVSAGGAASAIMEFYQTKKTLIQIIPIALPNKAIHHGNRNSILTKLKLDKENLIKKIQQEL